MDKKMKAGMDMRLMRLNTKKFIGLFQKITAGLNKTAQMGGREDPACGPDLPEAPAAQTHLPQTGAAQPKLPPTDISQTDLLQLIANAHREWRQAYDLFNEAREPQMVDHAIFILMAAELRYSYFIKQAKLARLGYYLRG
jgi:hypothetical protein